MRGLWHWPVLAGPFVAAAAAGDLSIGRALARGVLIAISLIVSNMFFGSVFGWLWYRTESLPLLGWCHQWYDAARDVAFLVFAGYAASTPWAGVWAIPFNLTALFLLGLVACGEGTTLKDLFRRTRKAESL